MITEKEYLRAQLIKEYKILDKAIRIRKESLENKDSIKATLNKWKINTAKQKIHQYKLELEILSEKGRF